MAYEPYTWKQSEVITSERLNHIENGISQLDSDSTDTDERFKKIENGIVKLNTNATDFNERLNNVESNISIIQSKQAKEKEETAAEDFEFVSGEFGLRVSKNGIQRTYDGGTTWINI